jgi:hypothetical protein
MPSEDVASVVSRLLSDTPSNVHGGEESKPTRSHPMTDHKVTLIVKSTSGTWPDAEFNTSNRVQKILDDGIKQLKLNPTPQAPYVLIAEKSGQPLPLSEKISDTGLNSGDVVVIQAGQPIDG